MFNIFRRSRPTPLTQPAQEGAPPQAADPAATATAPLQPKRPPAPDVEVVEGDGDTDWKLWEQAVTGQTANSEGNPSQWVKTWPGMEAPPPATPSQMAETVRMPRLVIPPKSES